MNFNYIPNFKHFSLYIPSIKNKTVLYLIIFFIILSISYIEDKLKPEYQFLRNKIFKLLILILIISFSENNLPISLSLGVVYIILSLTEINESFINNNNKLNRKIIQIV